VTGTARFTQGDVDRYGKSGGVVLTLKVLIRGGDWVKDNDNDNDNVYYRGRNVSFFPCMLPSLRRESKTNNENRTL
jgi:hypothetical protein